MKEIKEIEIEAFIQATEDIEKVLIAIKNIIPSNLPTTEDNFLIKKVRGVYHNPITIVRAKYDQDAKEIVEYIAKHLMDSDKQYLFQTLKRRVDKGNFYLRFGKQELFKGKIKIKEMKDTVKIRIGFSRKFSTLEKMTELLRNMELIES